MEDDHVFEAKFWSSNFQIDSLLWSICSVVFFCFLCAGTGLLCLVVAAFISHYFIDKKSLFRIFCGLVVLGIVCILMGSLLSPLCIKNGLILWSAYLSVEPYAWKLLIEIKSVLSYFMLPVMQIGSLFMSLILQVGSFFTQAVSVLWSPLTQTSSLLWSCIMQVGVLLWPLFVHFGTLLSLLYVYLESSLMLGFYYTYSLLSSVIGDLWAVLFTLGYLTLLVAVCIIIILADILLCYSMRSFFKKMGWENWLLYTVALFVVITILASSLYVSICTKILSLILVLCTDVMWLLWSHCVIIFLVLSCVFLWPFLPPSFRTWIQCFFSTTSDHTQPEPIRSEYYLQQVDPATHSAIEDIILETFAADKVGIGKDAKGLKHVGIEIITIRQVINKKLLQTYKEKVEKLSQRGKAREKVKYIPPALEKFNETQRSTDVNELYLFHGTKMQTINSIASSGFDVNVSSPHGLYGQGIYFAEKFTKADQYTAASQTSSGKNLAVILCRVLMGNAFRCHKHNANRWKYPPCMCCKKEACGAFFWSRKGRFDSVLGAGSGMLFREFVVYDGRQCYPEYIINYKRVDKKESEKCTVM